MTTSIPVYDVRLVKTRRSLRIAEPTAVEPMAATRVVQGLLSDMDREGFVCVFLNSQHEIIGAHVAAIGGQSTIPSIDARTILRAALAACATAMVVGHNHPSGHAAPSDDDKVTTAKLCAAAKIIGIPIVDHVIVTRDPKRFYSFHAAGEPSLWGDASC